MYKGKKGKIYQYWEDNAKTFGASHEASWGDTNMVNLEIGTIKNYIKKDDKVLDAGCANGYSTFHYLEKQPVEIKGFDYSPAMIAAADKEISAKKVSGPISFYQADICDIPEKDNYFDVSITTRVLINLPTWKLQQKAMDEIYRVTKPGGLILLSEAFVEGLVKINKLRKLFDLAPLKMPFFNKYLKEKQIVDYFREQKKISSFELVNFSSLYYIGSRVIREIYLDKGEKSSFKHFINDFFFKLEKEKDRSDFGIQKLCVIKKTK